MYGDKNNKIITTAITNSLFLSSLNFHKKQAVKAAANEKA
jgi:hypothetical protein